MYNKGGICSFHMQNFDNVIKSFRQGDNQIHLIIICLVISSFLFNKAWLGNSKKRLRRCQVLIQAHGVQQGELQKRFGNGMEWITNKSVLPWIIWVIKLLRMILALIVKRLKHILPVYLH